MKEAFEQTDITEYVCLALLSFTCLPRRETMQLEAHKSPSQRDVANRRYTTCLKLSYLARLSVQEAGGNNAAHHIRKHTNSGGGDC